MKIVERYGTVLRCYDNGGRTADRYSVVPPRWADEYRNSVENGWTPGAGANRCAFDGLSASRDPYHPQGVGLYAGGFVPGPHLGKRVHWNDLPEPVQKFARDSFPEYAPKQED